MTMKIQLMILLMMLLGFFNVEGNTSNCVDLLSSATLNTSPIAVDDFYTTNQRSTLNVPSENNAFPSILANDYDLDNDNLMLNPMTPVTLVSDIDDKNTLTINSNGDIQYVPGADFVGTDSFEYEICDDGLPARCANGVIFITVESCVDMHLFAFLEGPLNPVLEEMSTNLNLLPGSFLHRGVLPGQEKFSITTPGVSVTTPYQPYDAAPWSYNGLEGTFDAAPWYYAPGSMDPMGNSTYAVYHPDVVDWVLVRFRTGDPSLSQLTTEKTAAALLCKDGTVRFLESCVLKTSDIPGQMVYVQIDHRNHMAVMSDAPIDISNNTLTLDFRNQESYRTSTSFGQKEMLPGVFAMYAGDSDQVKDFPSYDLNGFDNIIWRDQNGFFDTYSSGDYNLDCDVSGADKQIWSYNNGLASRVPK